MINQRVLLPGINCASMPEYAIFMAGILPPRPVIRAIWLCGFALTLSHIKFIQKFFHQFLLDF
jgi:hypothetical protein